MDHISYGLLFLKRVLQYENVAYDGIAYERCGLGLGGESSFVNCIASPVKQEMQDICE